MRTYLIDDLYPADVQKLAKKLDSMGAAGSIDGIYWLDLPAEVLSDCQKEHSAECGPHCLALELGEDAVRLELLVRARNKLRCDCVAYADSTQREAVMNRLDRLLKELDIPV